ncbi:hypothetical protein A2686_02940 [Candidatus Woesebacteria bacterium RIFCSPHIGHO2_01_FULL_38_10]|uniref:Uncharacterized protein n=1 Tax=Candidatus Woesebacteria bacterium RIFCSPLOWO2_01_FULL_39_10b TaxID=1802517 RepID=A0A1F8B8Y5_9BACT|nr:MAG: hypothetical protein A2686_02940 [Candidatus Woesebacteria bacterium RIFCSPHIGHO2_01_FULL_38_10]OGM60514.1 MAG: hypothetical protein A2892_00630 [Candidatus Woesebacteria bacterium RIFCSPLOWO2_01_FULL_39_10b]
MKRLVLLFSSLAILLLPATEVFAQTDSQTVDSSEGVSKESLIAPDTLYPPYPGSEPGFLGQDHSYSVVFRGNGEAVVSAKIVFMNKKDDTLDEIKLRVTKVLPTNLSVYQAISLGRCLRYSSRTYDPVENRYLPSRCIEIEEPDYYSYYGNVSYQKAKAELDVDTLKITLPKAVASNKSGAFIIYFRAIGYAKKNLFGAFNYEFETLKAEEDIRNLMLGISTDSDLILKGVKGEVSYRFEESAFSALESAGAVTAPQKSIAMDRFVSQIGHGKINKSASNLAALESYKVEGDYASSRIKLYAKELTIGFLLILIFVGLTGLVVKRIYKKFSALKEKEVGDSAEKKENLSSSSALLLLTLGVSFFSSVLVSAYSVFVYLLSKFLSGLVEYQFLGMFALFLIIASFIIYAILIFAPAAFIGAKKGVGWGITTLVFSVIWIVLFLGVSVFIIFALINTGGSGPIVPLFKSL